MTLAERPELRGPGGEATRDAFPEYEYHADVVGELWETALERWSHCQFHLLEGDEIVARACSVPVRWDRTLEDLPDGLDAALVRAVEEGEATVLCAILIAIPRAHRGRRVSSDAIGAMVELARRDGLEALIAPVRPTWKERYPLVPIERYAAWRRDDGLPFDPWLRIHERVGGRFLRAAPRSLRFTGTVAEWEQWTEMSFPETGEYWFPGGLATLSVDREADAGAYWEPNVWMQHDVD